jgi:hypothetical protein
MVYPGAGDIRRDPVIATPVSEFNATMDIV